MSLEIKTEEAEKEDQRPIFLEVKRINGRDARIKKPEGATLVCRCGGYAKFWKGKKPENNGQTWHEIPPEFNLVYFPELDASSDNYGTPKYERSIHL